MQPFFVRPPLRSRTVVCVRMAYFQKKSKQQIVVDFETIEPRQVFCCEDHLYTYIEKI